jgi:hypothetical protein
MPLRKIFVKLRIKDEKIGCSTKKLYLAYLNREIELMKRLIATILFAAVAIAASAQGGAKRGSADANGRIASSQDAGWAVSFRSVKIDAAANVVFKQASDNEDTRIVYDTKGDETTNFRFRVDRGGMLIISEKRDPKRLTVTDVIIYYRDLQAVDVKHARVAFEDAIESVLLDVNVSGGATALLKVKVLDAAIKCVSDSRLTLEGSAKYVTMKVASAKVNCSRLSTVSATVECSKSAEVRLSIKERLEAKVLANSRLLYYGNPRILRKHKSALNGEVVNLN